MSSNATGCVQHSQSNLEELLEKLESVDPFVDMLGKFINEASIQHKVLAGQIPVGPSTLSQWLNRRRFPDEDKVWLLANALGLSATKKHILIRSWYITSMIQAQQQLLREALAQNDLQSASVIVNMFNVSGVVQQEASELEAAPVVYLADDTEPRLYVDVGCEVGVEVSKR